MLTLPAPWISSSQKEWWVHLYNSSDWSYQGEMSKQPPQPANPPLTGQLWGPAASLPWVQWRVACAPTCLWRSPLRVEIRTLKTLQGKVLKMQPLSDTRASFWEDLEFRSHWHQIWATLFLSAEATVGPFTRRDTAAFQKWTPMVIKFLWVWSSLSVLPWVLSEFFFVKWNSQIKL